MGFWGTLGKIGGIVGGIAGAPFTGGASLLPSIIGAAGSGLGAIAQGKAQNRGQEFEGQVDLEKLLMDRERQGQDLRINREQEGRAGATDAWKKLLATQYAQQRGAQPHLSPYSVAPRDLSGLQPGADALQREVMARLQGGNPIPQIPDRASVVDPSLLQAGGWEKAAGIGSALAPFLGMLGKKKAPVDYAAQGYATGY